MWKVVAIAAAFACGAQSACTPYQFSDEVQTLSSKMGSIDSSYQDNKQKIVAEKQLSNRIVWIRDKPTMAIGPGCTIEVHATNTGPCELIPKTPDTSKTATVVSVNTIVDPVQPVAPATDVCEPAAGATPSPKAASVTAQSQLPPAQLLKALDDYAAALAAVTKAEDRADFDKAAAQVSAAVGTLAGPYASVAKASSNAALWLVGQDLDNRRLQELQNATQIACKPIHDLAKALRGVLEDQRGDRLDGLYTLLILRMQALSKARNTPHVPDQAYGAALDDAQAAADAFQAVRATDPQATTQALSDAHDKLVLAVRNNDGQLDALNTSMQTFAQRANDLATAAGTTAKPPVKNS